MTDPQDLSLTPEEQMLVDLIGSIQLCYVLVKLAMCTINSLVKGRTIDQKGTIYE